MVVLPSPTVINVQLYSGGECSPVYPLIHSGPVLVLGNAFSLPDDYQKARQYFPDAPVIAVNGAAGFTKAFALFTQHPAKYPKWIRLQKRFHDCFTTHSAGTPKDKTVRGQQKNWREYVDFHWINGAGGATSGWGARRIARFMGFDLVILCGMPLDAGNYSDGKPTKLMRSQDVINKYRSELLADTEFHNGVVSMSGWTREVLGGIEDSLWFRSGR